MHVCPASTSLCAVRTAWPRPTKPRGAGRAELEGDAALADGAEAAHDVRVAQASEELPLLQHPRLVEVAPEEAFDPKP